MSGQDVGLPPRHHKVLVGKEAVLHLLRRTGMMKEPLVVVFISRLLRLSPWVLPKWPFMRSETPLVTALWDVLHRVCVCAYSNVYIQMFPQGELGWRMIKYCNIKTIHVNKRAVKHRFVRLCLPPRPKCCNIIAHTRMLKRFMLTHTLLCCFITLELLLTVNLRFWSLIVPRSVILMPCTNDAHKYILS
ncbi:hypothetical protein DPEC_G00284770 [Dallia pectoralis]|uniref:Uncharacterized protein n=1 Tax=Dallia pectoralis TaxID=75939 RepID=A0ACC2FJH8_DALPE|nr:hypothetical protein DPEC_G00284770 [Dallia pectoralis]